MGNDTPPNGAQKNGPLDKGSKSKPREGAMRWLFEMIQSYGECRAPYTFMPTYPSHLVRIAGVLFWKPASFECRAQVLRPQDPVLQLICALHATMPPTLEAPTKWMAHRLVRSRITGIAINRTSTERTWCRKSHEECDRSNEELTFAYEERPFMRCLALPGLVPFLEVQQLREGMHDENCLFDICFQVLL